VVRVERVLNVTFILLSASFISNFIHTLSVSFPSLFFFSSCIHKYLIIKSYHITFTQPFHNHWTLPQQPPSTHHPTTPKTSAPLISSKPLVHPNNLPRPSPYVSHPTVLILSTLGSPRILYLSIPPARKQVIYI
jgi:hypothetical protein